MRSYAEHILAGAAMILQSDKPVSPPNAPGSSYHGVHGDALRKSANASYYKPPRLLRQKIGLLFDPLSPTT